MTEQFSSWLSKGIFSLTIVAAVAVIGTGGLAQAAQRPAGAVNPTTKTQCYNHGFQNFQFGNQGQCVSWVESHGHGNSYGGDEHGDDGHNNGGNHDIDSHRGNFLQQWNNFVNQNFYHFHF